MKRTIMSVMAMVFFCISLLAQDLSMIRSKDALRTYALEQASRVSVNIGSYIPIGRDNTYNWVAVSEPTAMGISNSISSANLAMDVANPQDSFYTSAAVYNSDYDYLFGGSHEFKLINGKGGYTLPANYGDVTLELASEIPIKILGAQYAQISFQDKNGQTTYGDALRVYNGKVYFPRQLAGTNAILSVMINVGGKEGWSYWNTSSGASIKPEHFAISLKSTVQGVVSFVDNGLVLVPVPTTNSIGQNLTVEFKATTDRFVTVSFWTTENKWFKGARVRKAGTSEWKYYSATLFKEAGLMGFSFYVPTGIYYIIPEWTSGDLVEPADPWYPPYYYEGGGKG